MYVYVYEHLYGAHVQRIKLFAFWHSVVDFFYIVLKYRAITERLDQQCIEANGIATLIQAKCMQRSEVPVEMLYNEFAFHIYY